MAGAYHFTVVATDSLGASASQSYTLSIGDGVLRQFLVTVQGPGAVQAGNGFLVIAQAADQFGMPITSYTGPVDNDLDALAAALQARLGRPVELLNAS